MCTEMRNAPPWSKLVAPAFVRNATLPSVTSLALIADAVVTLSVRRAVELVAETIEARSLDLILEVPLEIDEAVVERASAISDPAFRNLVEHRT
jgi:hypothetical protein